MKKIISLLFSLFLLAVISPLSFADTTWISGGYKNDTAGASYGERFSFSYGQRWDLIGVEIGYVYYPNTLGGVLDYPCPHNDFTIIFENQKTDASGIDVLFFLDLNSFSLYAGPGLYLVSYRDVSKSNVTGWLYEQSSGSAFWLAGSAGIQRSLSENSIIGFGYHIVRGWNIRYSFKN